MGVKWRNFEMPKKLECDQSTYSDAYGKFTAEPFERGYGVTVGNSLRRILISSIIYISLEFSSEAINSAN